MPRKAKVSDEVKIKEVLNYINNRKSIIEISKEVGVCPEQVRRWIITYKSIGIEGLKNKPTNKYYSTQTKILAVKDFLSGKYSLLDVCSKYKISSISVLQRWIIKYNNNHNMTKSQNNKEKKLMIKGRKTTFDERVEIVGFCMTNNFDYHLTSDKYKVSYQQIYNWVRKYKKHGYKGLEDKRGKAKEIELMTEKEQLEVQMKLLKIENDRLKMEIDFLKKLEEIERR
ncbi:transposase [Paraclostridium benzoelyticum]|uniref:Transposase n=1 Tax=Paraclostridium benzoelyticum TaxID=1629550 RepID=A0A0M3DFF0_9FIRM|nr:helix-turn-helix domain-containing protein [Paraclostridium benzoelyticum]KKY00851.1 transposase [Paraclostridium benzoelyticum]KKY02112.1 transposase [Paraclostridium benzoelyticum]KKY02334.1 transposase [Paraclostridium benzoelyticum]